MNKILSYLGFAKKANQLSSGHVVLDAVRANRAKLVIVAEDTSDRSKKQLQDKCRYYHVPCYVVLSSEEISQAIGRNNIKTVSINDTNFASAVLKEIERNEVD